MKRIALGLVAVAALAIFSTAAKADPWSHGRLHDDLEHRAYHRELDHRDAHRYPMTWRQHERLHDHLDHESFHDRLDHRSYHRNYYGHGGYGYRTGGYYYAPRQSFHYSGRGFSFQYSR